MVGTAEPVRVFISWSGDSSQAVARALSEWLPDLVDHLQFWFSSDDLRSGQRWSLELANALSACDVGIITVTSDNMLSPWLTFEAGALSKNAGSARVIPYLVGVEPYALTGPLSQFQAAIADRSGTLRLVMDLARLRYADASIAAVSRRFDKFWPDFENVIAAARTRLPAKYAEDRAIELLRDQVTDLGQLVRQLVAASSPRGLPSVGISDNAATDDGSLAGLRDLEGAWHVDNGSHVYARVVNGRLLAPYCYTGNHELTGVYRAWRRVSEYWFTRFEWVDGSIAGFGFYRLENLDRVSGQWWMTDEVTTEVVMAPPPKAGVRAVWTRLPNAELPSWAERYFAEQL